MYVINFKRPSLVDVVSWKMNRQQLELCMEQLIGSGLRKEYNSAFTPSSCLFNLYAEHIIRNARLDELQAEIRIGGRNVNNPRYLDDTTLMAECEEELKSLLMSVEEESERASLKLSIKKTKIMASGPITIWQIEGGKLE